MTSTPAPATTTAAPAANNNAYNSSSLYVGDLAPDVSEGKLFDIFNSVGPVASIRVCRDAMLKRSLGYAYVNFHNQQDAERALETMNFTMIAGRPCRIMWSQRDPSLRKSGLGNIFVKGLHTDVLHKELQDTFSLFGNILSCKVALDGDGKSKGYGYVHFETEEAARAALERMDEIEIMGQKCEVQLFQKKQHPNRAAHWTNLFVKNVPTHLKEADIREMFENFGEVQSLKLMVYSEEEVAKDAASAKPRGLVAGASKGFGFVSYGEHEVAVAAAEALNGKLLPDPEGVARKAAKKAAAVEGGAAESTDKADADGDEDEAESSAPEGMRELYVGRAQKKDERQRELKKKFQLLREKTLQSFMGVNLYVKNLDDEIDDKAMDVAFKPFGTITSSRVMRNPDGTSKGFGFVCFSGPEEANAASNDMNGKVLGGKPIFVALAQRRDQRREMLNQSMMGQMAGRGGAGPGGGGPGGGMMPGGGGRGPMPGNMYGAVPMMYMGGRGAPPYGMPMAMMGRGMPGQGGRGMPGQGYQQRTGQYQMPPYPGGGAGGMPMGMQGQQGPARRQRNGRQGQPPQGGGQGARGSSIRQSNAPGQSRQQQQQPNIKFNPQARNQPNAGPQPGAGGMPPSGAAPDLGAPGAVAGAPAPLTPAALAAADEHMQKNMIGERLYPLIAHSQPDMAGKITGMLLEMDNSELLHLLESPEALEAKINEALEVLKAHTKAQQTA
eukprot:CAMPEP_0172612160 /NCGR_PEP_ID=MMETSP1068-20121228/31745_1 /TAXON_ID=35684 /ORGANISM="Pseudopedinella elastica, Strain CCMP716" /LENGTH=723 /DNA_ID=CAMNT_0013416305 /DNA_START=145 /DNA_END=2316 /DNA_ORIENTATION=-